MAGSSLEPQAKHAFTILQPLCTQLLELPLAQTDSDPSVLKSLAQALHDVPVAGLQVCMEYVLFPLQLLLDAAVQCRSPRTSASVDASTTPKTQLRINDKIAEGVLICLEELLHRCPVKTTSQLSLLLRKLTAAAMLSPEEASEEFRHGAVKCLKEFLVGLMPCCRLLCSCKLAGLPHPVIYDEGCLRADLSCTSNTMPESTAKHVVKEMVTDNEECLIEFLQSKSMSPAVGHLLSLFIQISDREALRGGQGSAKLRIDALSALRALIFKVGNADALAFFLPGVASGLVSAIRSPVRANGHRQEALSQISYPRGAAGSSGALEEAVRALAELLVLVLADERNSSALEAREGVSQVPNLSQKWKSSKGGHFIAEAALASLSELSVQLKDNKGIPAALKAPCELNSDGQVATNGSDNIHSGSDNVLQEEKIEQADVFRIKRNKEWMEHTATRIGNLLSLSFPAVCGHSNPSVRLAVTEGVTILILTCGITLRGSKLTFLECLLAMSCDDWPHVASVAQSSLAFLVTREPESLVFSSDVKADLRGMICRLIERLPTAVFSGNETVAVVLCRQLLAAMFFAGPEGVSDCIFQSPAATAQFVTVMAQCLSFNSAFAGSVKQLSFGKEGSLGYVPGISELNISEIAEMEGPDSMNTIDKESRLKVNERQSKDALKGKTESPMLPRMPPWLVQAGGSKIYREISGILRLSGLSSMFGERSGDLRHLYSLIEALLASLRRIPSEVQRELHTLQDEEDSYLVGGGKWQRMAATSVSVLNEVFYGASGRWIHEFSSLFGAVDSFKRRKQLEKTAPPKVCGNIEDRTKAYSSLLGRWEHLSHGQFNILSECVGDILHDYLLDEIWNLPIAGALDTSDKSSNQSLRYLHVLRDNSTLQQMILEGIGVLAVSIGKLFEEHGYLGSVLYLLLERLGCANYQVSSSADVVLHMISAACGYPLVKPLIVASADHIIDSLCGQLRHLDLHPGAPNMLVAVLRYTGSGQELISLLQEPMRMISLELEIPSRQQHPENTVPLLRALKEISMAARREGFSMLEKSYSFFTSYQALAKEGKESNHTEKQEADMHTDDMSMCDEMVSRLKEFQRCRESITDILVLCLNACAPLMASKDQGTCLLSLDIVEIGMDALSHMDLVAKQEKEQRAVLHKLVSQSDETQSFDETETPKLLPTMHRVWPHLAACLKRTQPSVLVQSLSVISSVVNSCGGEFFTRRIQKDVAPKMLTLLCHGTTLQLRLKDGQQVWTDQKTLPHLPVVNLSAQKEFAAASVMKVQEAVLSCISQIARNKKSAPALMGSMERLAAVAVGLACGVPDLQDCAVDALVALSNIDSDLIWILVADIAYGSLAQPRKANIPGLKFPEVSQLLPLLSSSKEALWMQLIGKDCSLNIDSSKAWTILSRIESVNEPRKDSSFEIT